MKKFIINVVAITGLVITVAHVGCSARKHTKQMRSYSNERYHKNYEGSRELRYEHPRYY